MIKQIVNWLVEIGTTNTSNGTWVVYYDEIASKFDITEDWVHTHRYEIIDELDSREEILSETWGEEDESFDMNFCLNACKDWDGTLEWGHS